MVKDIIIADDIPIMETRAMDFKAGCCAKIKMPVPKMVVTPDNKIDVLKVKILSLLS
jgi:hypothetical protein